VTQRSKCLVIDTDIASSAGGENAQAQRSKQCRDVLMAVRDASHKVVVTEMISEEWRKHQSNFTRTWLRSMYAKRKVCQVDVLVNDELRHKVEQSVVEDKKREAMLKDIHLIEAALATDKTIISMDETVRLYFCEMLRKIAVLKHIVWVNPSKDDELCIEWLHDGAESAKERMLVYYKFV
jgi:hypothetical protein